MKKQTTLLLSCLLTTGVFATTACNRDDDVNVDKTKTQLYIHNFAGGYGTKWLDDLKKAYEEANAEKSFEEGKTGVQVIITGDKKTYEGPEIKTGKYDLYFAEQCNYQYYVSHDYIEDLSELLNSTSKYDNKTLLSKFTDSQKGYMNVNGKYYAIPHYAGTYGITYDIDLFDMQGYYYAKGHPDVTTNPNFSDCFIMREEGELDEGPDGVAGTEDDGLPVTLDEFYYLCNYIKTDAVYPFVWTGTNMSDYLTSFATSLVTAIDGVSNASIAYSFNGTSNKIVKVNDNGDVIRDSNGNLIIESATINGKSNGYKAMISEGRYYALDFLNKIINTSGWAHPDSFSPSFSHLDAQDTYVRNFQGSKIANKTCAMLIDGTWWQGEASATWTYMKDRVDENITPMTRKYGLMPFPRVRRSDAFNSTWVESLDALQFVKKGLSAEKKALVGDFLLFANSDQSLVEFTKSTYTTRCLNYTIPENELKDVSIYGRSLYEYRHQETTQILEPHSTSDIYVENRSSFTPSRSFSTTVDGTNYNFPSQVFTANKGISTEKVFKGVYEFYKNLFKNM